MKLIHNKTMTEKEKIKKWIDDCLDTSEGLSTMSIEGRFGLRQTAYDLMNQGGLRGNISDMWKKAGVTTDNIKDLYL